MFTANERVILEELRHTRGSDLATLSSRCGLARSSVHIALQNLSSMGVVENVSTRGKAVYRITGRDALERAAQNLVAEFKSVVLPPTSLERKPRLVFTDNYVLPAGLLEQLTDKYDIASYPHSPAYVSSDLLLERARDAEVIVRFDSGVIDRAFLSELPDLKAIVLPACYTPNIDFVACTEFGVQTVSANPISQRYFNTTQIEYVVNAVLTLLRPLHRYAQRRSVDEYFDWQKNLGDDLFDKRVGIIFTDTNIHTLVAIFQAFGCHVQASALSSSIPLAGEYGLSDYKQVEELWEWCDIAIILDGVDLNLDPLLATKQGPKYLVMGSGQIEFDPALIHERMTFNRLSAVAIDMVPVSWQILKDNGQMQQRLNQLEHPNVIVTPELQVMSHASMQRNFDLTFQTLMNLKL